MNLFKSSLHLTTCLILFSSIQANEFNLEDLSLKDKKVLKDAGQYLAVGDSEPLHQIVNGRNPYGENTAEVINNFRKILTSYGWVGDAVGGEYLTQKQARYFANTILNTNTALTTSFDDFNNLLASTFVVGGTISKNQNTLLNLVLNYYKNNLTQSLNTSFNTILMKKNSVGFGNMLTDSQHQEIAGKLIQDSRITDDNLLAVRAIAAAAFRQNDKLTQDAINVLRDFYVIPTKLTNDNAISLNTLGGMNNNDAVGIRDGAAQLAILGNTASGAGQVVNTLGGMTNDDATALATANLGRNLVIAVPSVPVAAQLAILGNTASGAGQVVNDVGTKLHINDATVLRGLADGGVVGADGSSLHTLAGDQTFLHALATKNTLPSSFNVVASSGSGDNNSNNGYSGGNGLGGTSGSIIVGTGGDGGNYSGNFGGTGGSGGNITISGGSGGMGGISGLGFINHGAVGSFGSVSIASGGQKSAISAPSADSVNIAGGVGGVNIKSTGNLNLLGSNFTTTQIARLQTFATMLAGLSAGTYSITSSGTGATSFTIN